MKKIHKRCNICKQFANTPAPEEKKIGEYNYIFYGIDIFTKLEMDAEKKVVEDGTVEVEKDEGKLEEGGRL